MASPKLRRPGDVDKNNERRHDYCDSRDASLCDQSAPLPTKVKTKTGNRRCGHHHRRRVSSLPMLPAQTNFRKILSFTSLVLAIYSTKWGSGYHIWDVKQEWIPTYKKARLSSISLLCPNESPAGRQRRSAVYLLRHPPKDLGLLYVPRRVPRPQEHHLLLGDDRVS
jgi:hypothetical protein